ncbi:EexN family lipoprotein [Thermomonas sp.]|uniref:EexN family lipoprotein n=1 Tax=Thermomonas sp. TaxID=1971895 RepID=UPI002614EF1E|nr:EexN family lipoprotein [Thermomonas sp.]MCO5055463.1 EexN family lipoprotein [Thermomonas sp.]
MTSAPMQPMFLLIELFAVIQLARFWLSLRRKGYFGVCVNAYTVAFLVDLAAFLLFAAQLRTGGWWASRKATRHASLLSGSSRFVWASVNCRGRSNTTALPLNHRGAESHYRSHVEDPCMKAKTLTLGLLALCGILSACHPTEPTRSVEWFKENRPALKETIARCNGNPGELAATPNCINASRAQKCNHLERKRRRREG